MKADVDPPVLRRPGSDVGCACGCVTAIFLCSFPPFAAALIPDAHGARDGLWLALGASMIPTLGGAGMMGLFAIDAWLQRRPAEFKRRLAIQRWRREVEAMPDVSDVEFCAAIPDVNPDCLMEFRRLLAEFLGVPPLKLHPDLDLRLPDQQETLGGLRFCTDRIRARPLSPAGEPIYLATAPHSLDVDESRWNRCDEEARWYARWIQALERSSSRCSKSSQPHSPTKGPQRRGEKSAGS